MYVWKLRTSISSWFFPCPSFNVTTVFYTLMILIYFLSVFNHFDPTKRWCREKKQGCKSAGLIHRSSSGWFCCFLSDVESEMPVTSHRSNPRDFCVNPWPQSSTAKNSFLRLCTLAAEDERHEAKQSVSTVNLMLRRVRLSIHIDSIWCLKVFIWCLKVLSFILLKLLERG